MRKVLVACLISLSSFLWAPVPVALMVLPTITACAGEGTLSQNVDEKGNMDLAPLVNVVCDRHDEGVAGDTTLDEFGKSRALAESILMRNAFKQEKVDVAPIYDDAIQVLDRHDGYVNKSDRSPASKKLALLSSGNIRRTLNTAMKIPESKPTGGK